MTRIFFVESATTEQVMNRKVKDYVRHDFTLFANIQITYIFYILSTEFANAFDNSK